MVSYSYKGIGGLILVLLVLVALAVVPTGALLVNAEEKSGLRIGARTGSSVADAIIARIKAGIEGVLVLADKYNVTIPENLTVLIDEARSLLVNASKIVEESPGEAVRLALLAAKRFRPVAVYVLNSIPSEEREELHRKHVAVLVERVEVIVGSLKKRLSWLEEKGVKIPDSIWEKVDKAEQLVVEAKELVAEPGYDTRRVLEIVREVDRLVSQTVMELYKYTGRTWRILGIVEHSYHKFMRGLLIVARGINTTINVLEENNTSRAGELLDRLTDTVQGLIEYIDRALKFLGNKTVDENTTEALTAIRRVLVEVREHLASAKQYVDEGNVVVALDELQQALDKLLSTLREHQLPLKSVHMHLRALVGVSERVHRALYGLAKKIAVRRSADLILFLLRVEHRLHRLTGLYENGNISIDEYREVLESTKQLLENIKSRLEELPRPPVMIVKHIDKLINWIEEQLASLEQQA